MINTAELRERLEKRFDLSLWPTDVADPDYVVDFLASQIEQAEKAKVEEVKVLIEAHESYEALLSDELSDVCTMASVHGWKSSRYEQGVKMRKTIEELKSKLLTNPEQ